VLADAAEKNQAFRPASVLAIAATFLVTRDVNNLNK